MNGENLNYQHTNPCELFFFVIIISDTLCFMCSKVVKYILKMRY